MYFKPDYRFKTKQDLKLYVKNKKYLIKQNLEKYGTATCELCNKTNLYKNKTGEYKFRKDLLTIDHIKEVKHGGSHELQNLRVCCGECNQKRDKIFNTTDYQYDAVYAELFDFFDFE